MDFSDRYRTNVTIIDGMPTPTELEAWMLEHPLVLLAFVIASVWISLTLIFRIWSKFNPDRMAKKMIWSLILFIPFAGWIFYGGFYRPPPRLRETPPTRKTPGKGLFN